MHLSRYVKVYPYPDRPGYLLIYSTKQSSLILVPESLMASLREGSLSPNDVELLSRLGFLVADSTRESEEMREVFRTMNAGRKRFGAIVIMNMDCNLDCVYCFEGSQKGKTRYMTPETADKLVAFIERNHLAPGRTVSLTFYGGEPLMSLEMIISIATRIRERAQACNAEFSFNLVTNGTLLTEKTARTLGALGLKRAKVTLDGPPESHDAQRPFVSGTGSFRTILDNIKAVCDLLTLQISGNYTRENYREFPRLLDMLLEEGVTPERVGSVIFAPVTGSMKEFAMPEFNDGCISIDEPWLIDSSLYLREEIMRRGFATPKIAPGICMVEFKDDLVIGYDGSFYKCPAFVGMEKFSAGNLDEGVRPHTELYNTDVWKKEECLECAYLPLCFGGCRFLRYLKNEQIDDVDCKKSYLDTTLEKFLLQEMRYRLKKG